MTADPNTSIDSDRPSQSGDFKKQRPARRHRRLLIVGLIVLVLAAVGGAILYWQSTFYESTDDAYIEGHPIFVSARTSGNVVRVHVEDNQWVEQGAFLVEIDPCDYQTRLSTALAAVQAAQADEEQAVADVAVAQAQLAKEQQDLRRYEELAKEDAVATQDLDHSRAATRVAQANLDAAQKHLTSARAKTVERKASAEEARLELSYTKVRASQAGYVTQRAAVEGGFVAVGQALLALVTDDIHVIANFKETQLTRIRPGQRVEVRVDTYPDVQFEAHVDTIQAGTGAVFSLFPPQNARGYLSGRPIRLSRFKQEPEPSSAYFRRKMRPATS